MKTIDEPERHEKRKSKTNYKESYSSVENIFDIKMVLTLLILITIMLIIGELT